jgi:DNA repair photolyase
MWHKGRGATSNRGSRYHPTTSIIERDFEPVGIATEVTPERSRSIIATNQSPDVPFDTSINPYRGCEHGCIYCYARPTHAYMDLSPGLDFETRLFYKPQAVELLEQAFNSRNYQCKPIALGTNTDPYQPIEKEYRITRGILELMLKYRHPVSIVTKGTLLQRDIPLLAELATAGLTVVLISVTTLDNDLKRVMEPRAAAPAARLELIRQLREAGVPVGILLAPVIPAINDAELETILEQCAQAGAGSARYLLLRLPLEVADLFTQWLHQHFPDRAEHVLSIMRQCRAGELYRPGFGTRMRGTGVFADLLARRFERASRRFGLDGELPALQTARFRNAAPRQADLFDC